MTDANDEKRERVLECLDKIERGFHRKWDNQPDFRKKLKGKDRDILIDLDVGAWTLVVRDGKLTEIAEGQPDDHDVRIGADSEHFVDIMHGELSPMKAYFTNKIDVDAGMRDLMLVKSFLG